MNTVENSGSNDDFLFINAQKESESLKQRLFEIYILYILSKNLNFSAQINDFFDKSILFLKESLNIHDFCLMLLDEENKELKIVKADTLTYEAAKDITFKMGEGISGIVAETGEPIVIADVSKEEKFLHYKGKIPDIGSFMSIPLKLNYGKVVGILNIHKKETHAFSQNDKILFSTIANNMAHTIERARLYEKAQKQSMLDDLTSLYTRRYFLECSNREHTKAIRHGDTFSIILLDIDHFKIINDTYGHPLGDEALKKISSLLRACVRQGDVISRYGGEEFAILLPGTDKEGATITAEKIRGVMENDLKINVGARKTRNITLTAGVASYPEDGDTVEKIIAAADKYLYIGKEAGRNRVINKSVDTKVSVADAEEKRIARRSRLALKAIMNINQPRFFEIKIHDREWKMCNVKDISKSGLFGETEYEIKNGEIYTCRAVSSKEVCSRDTFMVKVAHTIRATDGRYRFGASILEENKVWLRLVSLLTY